MPRLNQLGGKSWLKSTKSVWRADAAQKGLIVDLTDLVLGGALRSDAPPRDELKKKHPATFSEKDIAKLIKFFTKPNQIVLDPFLGTGSTALACLDTGRRCIGIELYDEWLSIAKRRIAARRKFLNGTGHTEVKLFRDDSLHALKVFDPASIDFIVTSPPYWNMLAKQDHKAKQERIAKNLPTKYGAKKNDFGNAKSFSEFLELMAETFYQYRRILKHGRYATVIVSDFRHKHQYFMFHAHIAYLLEQTGFTLQGLINLVQDNKKLYPYGYPTTFVPNISNQFIVVARKI